MHAEETEGISGRWASEWGGARGAGGPSSTRESRTDKECVTEDEGV